ASVRAEHEVYGTEHAERRPQVVELQRLLEIEHREGHEYAKGDDLLQNLQLADAHDLIADAVPRHLQQVLEQRNAPADESGDEPRPRAQLFQMGVPGESHEDVAHTEQEYGQSDLPHRRMLMGVDSENRSRLRRQRRRITSRPFGGSRSCLSLYMARSAALTIGASALPSSGKLATPTPTLRRTIFTSTSSVVENTTLRMRCATSSATARSASVSSTTNSSSP